MEFKANLETNSKLSGNIEKKLRQLARLQPSGRRTFKAARIVRRRVPRSARTID